MDLFSDYKYKIKKNSKIRLIELFGGIGAQAKALERLGVNFEHYRLVEFDKYAVSSYNAIHKTNFEPLDITKIKGSDLGIIDTKEYVYIMTYSFPCQDLSVVGSMKGMSKGSGTRSGLLWEVERLLNECRELPQVLLMENVPQVISEKNKKDFELWTDFLVSKGYFNTYKILNAVNFGIPQNRKRCFMVSVPREYYFEFPSGKRTNKTIYDLLENEVDEKYYLKGEKVDKLMSELKNNVQGCNLTYNSKHTGIIFDYRYDEGIRIKSNQKMCPTICAVYGNESLSRNIYIMKLDENSIRIRKLTHKECWRLMGFDNEDFNNAEKVNLNTQLYKQAGNSIVVNVLESIFRELFE